MLEYITTDWKILKVPNNEFNKWALAMLDYIWGMEWWEETQDKYFIDFYDWCYDWL
jgi:hypothetical protein